VTTGLGTVKEIVRPIGAQDPTCARVTSYNINTDNDLRSTRAAQLFSENPLSVTSLVTIRTPFPACRAASSGRTAKEIAEPTRKQ
jgi:hypothetical protein